MKIKRAIIEIIDSLSSLFWVKKIVHPPQGFKDIRLNLGCGLTVYQGWINIDGSLNALISKLPKYFIRLLYKYSGSNRYFTADQYQNILCNHYFIKYDLTSGIPAGNCVVKYIFTSHFLEHIYLKDAEKLIKECFRVLEYGGILRIGVPDLEHAVNLYLKGNSKEMLDNYFFVEDLESDYSKHRYMYNFELLSNLLINCGFCDIKKCHYQIGEVPDLHFLDNRPTETLFVECKKIQ
jgi:predicted SAM-dependent methyltransferase